MRNKLLISTMLKFILYDGLSYKVLLGGDLAKGTAHYSGVTWNNDAIFVAGANDMRYVIYKFDKSFQAINILDTADLHEPHQILWKDDKLYVTNTGLNRIEIMNGDMWGNVCWKHATYDIDHINGVWADGDRFYISEYRNRTEGKSPSAIRICNSEFDTIDEVSINVNTGIHNVYVENGNLYTLISNLPQMIICDLETRVIEQIHLNIPSPTWVRGLARTSEYWYIGVSQWQTERDKRHVGDGLVLEFDNNFNETGRLFMADVGPVFDIRVIDNIDLAHNGVPF